MSSIWYGNQENGIEIRQHEGEDQIDEIVMYQDGKVVFHIEQMDDCRYWMGFFGKTHCVHALLGSRGHVHLTNAEGWSNV